jgi:hypothetical protein
MSTYYYACCDTCKQRLPFWGRWVGGSGYLRPASDDAERFQDFLYEHLRHGITIANEHDDAKMEYECAFEDEED